MSLTLSNFKFGNLANIGRRRKDAEPEFEYDGTPGGARRRRLSPQNVKIAIGAAVGIAVGVGLMHIHTGAVDVLAVVNGKLITQDELNRRLENASGQGMMRQIATQEMQLQFVQSEGALPTAAWMDAKIAELKKSPNFDQMLTRLGQTEDDYRMNLQIHVAQAALLSRGLTITDADIHQYYQTNINPKNAAAQFFQPEAADISVIVMPSASAAAQAEGALKVGTPFTEVAAKYSIDSSRLNGGSLPSILRGRTNSARIPGLEDYIFSMRVGQTSEPQKFSGTYWIIHCLNRTPAKSLTFEQVKEDCDVGARMAKGAAANGARVQAKFESFQRSSRVQAFSLRYQDSVNAH